MEVNLTFEQAMRGAQVPVSVETPVACADCGGSGAKPGTNPRLCPECKGRGVRGRDVGSFAFSEPCPRCGGNGTVIDDPCPTCGGSGHTSTRSQIKVKIPAGVKDGTRIRLKGKGQAGTRGGPAGDLQVITRVAPSRLYTRQGDDLVINVPVTFAEAALGAQVEVPTLDGRVKLTVPAGQRRRAQPAHRRPGRAAAEGRGPRRPDRQAARGGAARAVGRRSATRSRSSPSSTPATRGRRCSREHPPRHGPRVFLIGIAAELAGMHPQTLRVYERRGLITPQRTARNTRVYSEADVALLRRIQELSEEGLNLAGIERVLKLEQRARARRAARPRPGAPSWRRRSTATGGELAEARAARGQMVLAVRGSTALTHRHTPVAARATRTSEERDLMAVDKPTERAQEAIAGSARIAAERGNPVVEPDHLLAAAARGPRGRGRAGAARAPAPTCPACAPPPRPPSAKRPQVSGSATGAQLSNPYRAVLRRAGQEAEGLDDQFISTEHLLLALLEEPGAGARGADRQRRDPRRPADRAARRCAARRA